MNEFVFAPSYRDLSRGCCVSVICLLIQFSFKSATETSECKAHVANSQWQRVPYRWAGSGEAAWSISRQSTAWNCQIVTGSRTEMMTSCRRHRSAHVVAQHLLSTLPTYWDKSVLCSSIQGFSTKATISTGMAAVAVLPWKERKEFLHIYLQK